MVFAALCRESIHIIIGGESECGIIDRLYEPLRRPATDPGLMAAR
jgi:hypothetical protein